MKGTYLGHDPDLGRKFSEESSGLVIGSVRSSPNKSEAQMRQDYIEEHGREPDAQQLHDAMLLMPDAANSATKEPLEQRMAQMTPAQMGKLYDDLM